MTHCQFGDLVSFLDGQVVGAVVDPEDFYLKPTSLTKTEAEEHLLIVVIENNAVDQPMQLGHLYWMNEKLLDVPDIQFNGKPFISDELEWPKGNKADDLTDDEVMVMVALKGWQQRSERKIMESAFKNYDLSTRRTRYVDASQRLIKRKFVCRSEFEGMPGLSMLKDGIKWQEVEDAKGVLGKDALILMRKIDAMGTYPWGSIGVAAFGEGDHTDALKRKEACRPQLEHELRYIYIDAGMVRLTITGKDFIDKLKERENA